MEKLKIKMVKFYQGVVVANNSNQTSAKAVYTRSVAEPRLISIEHGAIGIMITTELKEGGNEYTLIPYNNVAYVSHEIVKEDLEQKGKPNAMKPAAQAAKASIESK